MYRVGIAGLGVVGAEVAKEIVTATSQIHQKGSEFTLTGITARSKNKDRGFDTSTIEWLETAKELACSNNIDIFIELIGGEDGDAYEAVSAALSSGKHVVTANKAMMAKHGVALTKLAEAKNVSIGQEAAVAGGIPILASLKNGLGATSLKKIAGMLNGTCNYILSEMASQNTQYEDALKDAQEKGYAEADPTLDVGGGDAAQKLAILATMAFGREVNYGQFPVQGIEIVTADDILAAGKLGFRIKQLATASSIDGKLDLRVEPVLLNESHPMAQATGSGNFITLEGDSLGSVSLTGPGAGAGPTASAVLADVLSIGNSTLGPVFGYSAADIAPAEIITSGRPASRYYLKVSLKDVAGAIAGVSEVFAEEGISIDSLLQPSTSSPSQGNNDRNAMLMVVTHKTGEQTIKAAAKKIEEKTFALGPVSIIRIEDFD